MKNFIMLFVCALVARVGTSQSTVTDVEGNVYPIVAIGNQVWMAENLEVTHYRNGLKIAHMPKGNQWYNPRGGGYCYYNNDSANAKIYGALYNWKAVSSIWELCPAGWHIPDFNEWKMLAYYLAPDSSGANNGYDDYPWRRTSYPYLNKLAGEKLKMKGGWLMPQTDNLAQNNNVVRNGNGEKSSGFNALPGGYRSEDGAFYGLAKSACWWSSTRDELGDKYGGGLVIWISELFIDGFYMDYGSVNSWFSVRCIRD